MIRAAWNSRSSALDVEVPVFIEKLDNGKRGVRNRVVAQLVEQWSPKP